MSNEKKDGGPAFPVFGSDPESPDDIVRMGLGGMSLRDYFAAKAMPEIARQMVSGGKYSANDNTLPDGCEDKVASRSYKWADAMLKAREQ